MSVSSLLRWYARKGLFRPLRKSAYRKLCRRDRGKSFVVEMADGQTMHAVIGDSVDDQIYAIGEYEPHVTAVIRRLAMSCDTFVDVGCNIGYFSCLVARAKREVRLIAADPNPRMIERTQENLGLNGRTAVTLLNVGIGASNRAMTLYVPRDRHSLSSLAYRPEHGAKGGVDTIEAEVKRLFDAVPAGSITHALLKVDAEGFEYEVFSGITAAESEAIRFVVFELSARNLAKAGVDFRQIFGIPWFAAYTLYLFDPAGKLVPLDPAAPGDNLDGNVVMARHGYEEALAEFVVPGPAVAR